MRAQLRGDDLARRVLDATPAILVVLTTDGAVEYVNPSFERLSGYRLGELRRRDWFESFVPAPERAQARAAFLRVAGGGPGAVRVNGIVTRDGEAREIEWRSDPLRDESGNIEAVVETGTDVTARRKADDTTRRSEQLLRAVVSGAPVVTYALDVRGVFRLSEGLALEKLGLRPGEVVGLSALELYRDVPGFIDTFRKALGGEQVRLVSNVGDISFQALYAPSYDDRGEVDGVIGVAFDVTESVRAAERIARSEQRLAEAHRVAGLGAWELDLVTGEIWWSDEQYRLAGIEPGQRVDHSLFLDLVHPDDRQRIVDGIQALQVHGTLELDYQLVRPDGATRHMHGVSSTVRDAAGRTVRLAGTNQDVTERWLAERRIATSLREKETLLREIHHRVKNNLQVITSLVHFQARKAKSADEATGLRDLRQRIIAMALVHERLYLSNDVALVDLGGYLRALLLEMSQALEVGAEVIAECRGGDVRLPIELAVPCGMIVTELVTNALKHAFPAGTHGHVVVSLSAEDDHVVLAVHDDGAGFPDGFDASSAPSFGWALVRTLTQQVDGTIEARNDRGACVRLRFRKGA